MLTMIKMHGNNLMGIHVLTCLEFSEFEFEFNYRDHSKYIMQVELFEEVGVGQQ